MNQDHAQLCGSPEWADFIVDDVVPTVLADHVLGADLLEIGPGYGAATARLIDLPGTLTAVEIDSALAATLRERLPGVRVVEGRGEDLPFADADFSAAFCFTMLHHVQSMTAQDGLFAEVHRVLRPGGLFAGSDSIASDGLRDFHHHDVYTPIDPQRLGDRLDDAGFVDVSVELSADDAWFAFSTRAT